MSRSGDEPVTSHDAARSAGLFVLVVLLAVRVPAVAATIGPVPGGAAPAAVVPASRRAAVAAVWLRAVAPLGGGRPDGRRAPHALLLRHWRHRRHRHPHGRRRGHRHRRARAGRLQPRRDGGVCRPDDLRLAVAVPVPVRVRVRVAAGRLVHVQVVEVVVHVHVVELDVLILTRLASAAVPAMASASVPAGLAMAVPVASAAAAMASASVPALAVPVAAGLPWLGRLAGSDGAVLLLFPSASASAPAQAEAEAPDDVYVGDDLAGVGGEPVGDLLGVEGPGHRHRVVLLVVGDGPDAHLVLDLAEDLPDLLVALVALKIHPHDHRRHLKNANYSGSSVPYTQSDVHKKEARD
uniref:Uncharacterized protein n=1 Tax=Zea mays TaxID=4577 RepID=B7ZYY7_MAIZE|nr:unknown [Zea mays]